MLRCRRRESRPWLLALAMGAMLPAASCTGGDEPVPAGSAEQGGSVRMIQGRGQLEQVLRDAGDQLVLIDLFAEWCMPCRILSPVLEQIARERSAMVLVYKIDIDQNRDIARAFNVTGIPLVVFLKNGERIHAMTGVQSKAAYERAIERFAAPAASSSVEVETPDGELVDGVRVIRVGALVSLGSLHVYRGETVRMEFEGAGFPFGISIPDLGVREESPRGEALAVSFKAEAVGVYPLYCNGQCPVGDGERLGRIIVAPFQSSGEGRFTELSAAEARRLMGAGRALALDVRTPNEYYEGHIENARLVPLHQLESRLAELEPYRDRPILLYCRSGNRSTVAAEILLKHGFKDLYNLSGGIKDWARQGLPVSG